MIDVTFRHPTEAKMDLSRFDAAPISHLCGLSFESQGAFPAKWGSDTGGGEIVS